MLTIKQIRDDREAARTARVKGDAQAELDDARAEYEQERQHTERRHIGIGHGHDISEEAGGQISRCIAGTQTHEKNAQGHPDRPDDADGRILADTPPRTRPFDTERREYGKHHCTENGVLTQVEGQPQSAERGMRNAARKKDRAAADDVGSHDPAGDARKQTGEQRIVEVGVSGNIAEEIHPYRLLFNSFSSDS